MSTPQEKVEAQRFALNSWPRQPWHRHLIGPEELQHLLRMHIDPTKEQERFEAWISSPPYERPILRFPNDPQKHGWPGQYVDLNTQLAWEAWREALKTIR